MDVINWILSGLTTALSVLVFFFVKKWISAVEISLDKLDAKVEKNKEELSRNTDSKFLDAIGKFEKVADRLEDTVDAITNNIHTMNTLIEVFKKETQMKNAEIEKELSDKKTMLMEHDKELRELHSKINSIDSHCKYKHDS